MQHDRNDPQAQSRGGAALRMFETRHALPRQDREAIARMLNARLASATDLYSQCKHAHWNVKGMDFYQLHLLFDELAEMVEKHVDTIAERVTALGGTAMGTLRMAASASTLPEFPAEDVHQVDMVEALAVAFARHAEEVGAGIDEAEQRHDKGTADMLTDVVRDLDKGLYFLEAHRQGRDGARA